MRSRVLCLLLCIELCLIVAIGCARKGPAVALIGRKGEILLEELKEDYSRKQSAEALKTAKPEEMRGHLDRMIDDRIKVLAAYDHGLDRDSTVLAAVHADRSQRLLNKLYEKEIIDRVVREPDIREYYALSGKDVVIRKITFFCGGDKSQEDESRIKQHAEEILQRIRSGEDFASLAREFSDDKSSAMNGGLVMTPLSWSHQKDAVLEEAFYLRLGEISGVLKNEEGYHIIKVEEIRDKKRPQYHEIREEIRRKLIAANRKEITEKAKEYWVKMKETNRIRWNEDGIAFLLAKMQKAEDQRIQIVIDSLETLGTQGRNTPLVEYEDGRITIDDFRERLKGFPENQYIPWNNTNDLKAYIEQWVLGQLFIKKALSKGLDKERDVVEGVREAMERKMVNILMNRFIVRKILPTEEEIHAYYEKNKEDEYVEPEKVKIQEVMLKDETMANRVADWARSGRDFTRLAREYTERPGYKEKDGILDYFRKGRWGAVGEKAFDIKVGEIAGPIPLDGNRGYAVIKLLDRKPPRIKSYEEAKNKVRSDLVIQIRRDREGNWLSQMREICGVHVQVDVLEKVFSKE